jgi:hypothetical protein
MANAKRASVPFGNVLEALGALDATSLESTSYWDFYNVKYPTPAGFKLASYLSLSHDCPQSEASNRNLTRWKNLSGGSHYTLVVTSRSRHAQDLSRSATLFRANSATTSRELLFENVVSGFLPRQQEADADQYFIEPDIALVTGETRPALTYLVADLLGQSEQSEEICADVLVAPAGLGKTTLARKIARKVLQSKRAIPIPVESAQWQNLINLTLPNILNAALLQLIPEAVRLTNPKLFQVLVREQLLVPIFDGFDELCLHPHSNYHPTSLIAELLELVGDTGARVLITTRETFWEKVSASNLSDKVKRVNLQGFSNDQRKRFFSKRLKTPEERDLANRLAREVGERVYEGALARKSMQADRASGVPLFLELVALNVDGNSQATFAPQSKDPLGPLLESMCERENVRQQLKISAEKQMRIFEDLFRDMPDDISRSDLAVYVELAVPEVTMDALARFESHAFFSPGQDVRARFESLKVYFVARWLANRLEDAISESTSDKSLAELLERNSTGDTDVFDFLVERFVAMERPRARAAISHAVEMVQARTHWEGAASALFHLAQRIASEVENTKMDRRNFLLDSLGLKSPVRRLAVYGQITGLDLTELTFSGCVFKDVEYHNCNFDETTRFEDCRFDGDLKFENCQNSGRVCLNRCKFSEQAEREWQVRAGRASKKLINQDVVREAIREILRKFIGPFGFSTIKDADKNTGPILRSPCRDLAWEELFREKILERHHISGVSDGGINIVDMPTIRHEVRNFLDNAALGPHLRLVLDEILKRS